jgi:nucleoside-diphosphate-sugar epimerase
MKSAIVTGATSFIGMHLTKKLSQKGIKVHAIIRPNSPKKAQLESLPGIKICELEMYDYDQISEQISEQISKGKQIDAFFSFAWLGTRGSDRNNKELQWASYSQSIAALDEAINLGCKVIVSAGSQAEYGRHNEIITEETPGNPESQYGAYKLAYYNQAKAICKTAGVTFYEPRFFSIYGIGDFPTNMIPSILSKMLSNQTCDLTLCTQMWDYMNVEDAITALLMLIDNYCNPGVYNFGSGKHRPLSEFIEMMYELTGSTSKLNFGAIPYDERGAVNLMPSISKLKSSAGFSPSVSFEQGINAIISEMKMRSKE